MKRHFLFFVVTMGYSLIGFQQLALAEEEGPSVSEALLNAPATHSSQTSNQTSQNSSKNIHQGNWSTGGNATLRYDSSQGLELLLMPSAQYFFTDKISVGGDIVYYQSKRESSYTLAPAATYYFNETENTVMFVSQNIGLRHDKVDYAGYDFRRNQLSTNTAVGINYFINPNVAVGPRVNYNYNSKTLDSVSALFGFQIYF